MKITLRELTKVYNDAGRNLKVLDQVSFEFQSGMAIAIVGRSGVGKSTLLHLLGGLDIPTEGEIVLGSTCISALSDNEMTRFRREHIGFIFQFHHLLPEFTAIENTAMPLVIRGQDRTSANNMARELLKAVGLEERISHRPGELSGGEQQRVAVARALVGRPSIVLADEPTGNLDYQTGEEVKNLLLELNKSFGTTLIIATHDRELASKMDYVVEMMPGGKLEPLT